MKGITVMITGAGAPGAPGIIKSLRTVSERKIRIVGVDASRKAVGFAMVDKAYSIPKANASDFINEVYKICEIEKVDVILPLVTRELFKFSEFKQWFKLRGIEVAVSDENSLKIANDKGNLLDNLKGLGIDTPEYYLVDNIEDFKQAVERIGYPHNPVCFKPTVANGSRGFRVIDNSIDRGKLLFESKPDSVVTDYNEIIKVLENIEQLPELAVMEFLPGEEYSIDMLVNEGKPLYTIPRRRDKMNGGISVSGTVIKDEEIIDYCNNIVSKLKLHGNIGIQVRRDKEGRPKILEINPRVQGTIVLCTAAGANLPYYGVKLALGENIPKAKIKWGIEMYRYWEEVYFYDNGFTHAF